jgi:20S proteasome subunit beta 2
LGLFVQEDEAKTLVQEAILAGIFNDLGSGSNVDVTTIKKVNGKVEVVKEINCIKPNEVSELRSQINRDIVTHIPRGATRTSLCLLLAGWLYADLCVLYATSQAS